MAKIIVATQGVSGGKFKNETKGLAILKADILGHEFYVALDGFSGAGESYKPLSEPTISFRFPNGKEMQFETAEDLYMALTGCRKDETNFPPF